MAVDVRAWAKSVGFKTTVPADEMHVTVCYSKTPVDWGKFTLVVDNCIVPATAGRWLHQFGEAVALLFHIDQLNAEHLRFRQGGASHDFPAFRAHVTITYGQAPAGVSPYAGPLVFGPEIFQRIKKNWHADIEQEVLKAEFDLAAALNNAVLNDVQVPIDLGTQMTTSRLITLGFLSQAETGGTKTYQIDEVLDDKTRPVCQYMNGKTFQVGPQMGDGSV